MEPELPLQNSKGNPFQAFLNKRWLILLAVLLIALAILASTFLRPRYLQKNPPKPPVKQPANQPVKPTEVPISDQSKKIATFSATQAIAKIGNEIIYKKDLDTELAAYPPVKTDRIKLLVDKMINDSLILQGAAADKFIKLDSKVFNSLQKDYTARVKLVQEAKNKLIEKEDSISGTLVILWFFNERAGAVGYEKGQQIALEKITKLHDDVVSKKITIEQAGKLIQDDSSLAQVDPSYKVNAMFQFKANKNGSIYFDSAVDKALWQLQEGEVSQVLLSNDKDKKTGQMIPAVYSFGQVQKMIRKGDVGIFTDWLAGKKKQYGIKYY